MGCLTLFATHYFELTQLAKSADSNHGIRNGHVAASDIDGQLLLLHQIRDGAASSSFGLHVAKMAGIPTSVLRDAERYLQQTLQADKVENYQPSIDTKTDLTNSKNDHQAPNHSANLTIDPDHNTATTPDIVNNIPQKQLFSLYDTLNELDPDSLTPKQALDMLYTLKQGINR